MLLRFAHLFGSGHAAVAFPAVGRLISEWRRRVGGLSVGRDGVEERVEGRPEQQRRGVELHLKSDRSALWCNGVIFDGVNRRAMDTQI